MDHRSGGADEAIPPGLGCVWTRPCHPAVFPAPVAWPWCLVASPASSMAVATGATHGCSHTGRRAHSPEGEAGEPGGGAPEVRRHGDGAPGPLAARCARRRAVQDGERTRVLAQRLVPHVPAGLAPAGAPRLRPAGGWEALTALVTPAGPWLPPARRPVQGPRPTPGGMPPPGRRSAQGVTSDRRRRLVRGAPRVVCGPRQASAPRLATRGGKSIPACGERLHLDCRPPGAAMGRRVNPRCTPDAGWRHQRALCQTDHQCVLSHARLRWPRPDGTHGPAAVPRWQQRPPAPAAGLVDNAA